jgi:hypothetical protein
MMTTRSRALIGHAHSVQLLARQVVRIGGLDEAIAEIERAETGAPADPERMRENRELLVAVRDLAYLGDERHG